MENTTELRVKRKHRELITHLLRFNNGRPINEGHINEYLAYQSVGGEIPKDNPLLDCQNRKMFLLG